MEPTTLGLLVLAGIFGGTAGYFVRKSQATRHASQADVRATAILDEARVKEKQLLVEASEKSLKIIEGAKEEEAARRRDFRAQQERLEKRESLFDQKLLDLENRSQKLQVRDEELEKLKQQTLAVQEEEKKRLEKVAELTREEAKQQILDTTEHDVRHDIAERMKKLEREGEEQYEERAKTILSTVIQRYAGSHAAETTTTILHLPNEEMKGRIIGREGRNIKTVEKLTGVEIIVDETPEAIVISGFSLLRRHLAKRVLELLIADGRIHPARIEETIDRVKKELAKEIKKAGEEAMYETGVAGLDPKLIQLLGRLKYRTSYGQSVLQHSIEVSFLSGMLAEELGANVAVARKGGLLHDIGKAIDHEVQGSHPQLGYEIMKKYGLPEEVAYISIAHHEDIPRTVEGAIVKVADTISGARPGARKDTYEQYIQRLEELESLVSGFQGVEKVYAIQAGREVRVFVSPEAVDDDSMMKLAKDIAHRIEEELKYPGEIKVNVIREKRIVEYAR